MSDTPEPYVAPLAPARSVPGDPKLGRQALLIAVIVLLTSLAASVLVALFATELSTTSTSTSAGFNLRPDLLPATLHILGGSVLGILAMVLGIRAAVLNRGRVFGIIAAVIAAGAPLVSLILWAIVGFATAQ